MWFFIGRKIFIYIKKARTKNRPSHFYEILVVKSESLNFEIFPFDLYAATVVNLESDTALGFTDEFVVEVDHRFAVKPSLNVVTLDADAHSVPFAFFEDAFFFIGNLLEPAAAIRFVDACGVAVFGSYFTLPAVNDCGFFDERTEEYA